MSAMERWDDDAFLRLMTDVVGDVEVEGDDPVNLATERQNPVVSWDEFAGNFN